MSLSSKLQAIGLHNLGYSMSLTSHWLQNGQPSNLEERKKVRLSKEPLTKKYFVYTLSTLTACHFGASGSSET